MGNKKFFTAKKLESLQKHYLYLLCFCTIKYTREHITKQTDTLTNPHTVVSTPTATN